MSIWNSGYPTGPLAGALCLVLLMDATSLPAAPVQDRILLDETAVLNLRIETEEADYRDFEETFFAIGRIEEIPASRSVLSSRIGGRAVDVRVFVGDEVEEGDVLVRVESRQPGDPPPTVDLLAPQSGLVVDSHVRLGQPVAPEEELLDIVDRTQMWAVARVPEQEAASLQVGTPARLRVPAMGDAVIDARLSRFGVEADREAGTIEAIFEVENPDGRLRPGMRAEFSVVVSRREDVMSVPREALQGDPSQRAVFVRDFDLPNAFIRSPVVVGAMNDRYVEIISGVFPGDEVVTQGSYLLSFANPATGGSLKEALDAAHGHEHNEDGSEIVPGEQNEEDHEGHDHEAGAPDSAAGGYLKAYCVVVTLLSIVLATLLFRKRGPKEASDA